MSKMLGTLGRRPIRAGTLFSAIVVLATGFALLSFVSTAVAVHPVGVPHNAYVLAVDPIAQTLNVRLSEKDISSDMRVKGEITLNTSYTTLVTMCDQSKSFGDIRGGDTLSLMFHETEGAFFADSIAIQASPDRKC